LPQVRSGGRPSSLFDAEFPVAEPGWKNREAEQTMEVFIAVVAGLRSAREELGLPRDAVGRILALELTPGAASGLVGLKDAFRQLSGCELAGVVVGSAPRGRFASVEAPGVKALFDLEGLVDLERERERLISKAKKAAGEVVKAEAKLNNEGFRTKAPRSVVEEERTRLAGAKSVLAEVTRQYEERIGGELPLTGGSGT
jgi:valyl-tRNA synthetase